MFIAEHPNLMIQTKYYPNDQTMVANRFLKSNFRTKTLYHRQFGLFVCSLEFLIFSLLVSETITAAID